MAEAVDSSGSGARRRTVSGGPHHLADARQIRNEFAALDCIINLSRNVGGSIGISFVTTVLARRSQWKQARVVHFNVTAHPTAEWTARQVIQAFREETAPRFLVRDREEIHGERFRRAIEGLGFEVLVAAAKSPRQNPYAERLIGSLRRECLDHVIVLEGRQAHGTRTSALS